MKSVKLIQRIIDDLLPLLNHKSAMNWHAYFSRVLEDSRRLNSDDEVREWARRITGVYGGTGSFSDLYVEDESGVLKKQTIKMDVLRKELLDATMATIQTKVDSDYKPFT